VAGVFLISSDARRYASNLYERATNHAVCVIDQKNLNPTTFLINNESDFGYEGNIIIKNTGKTGLITASATLSTPEGQFIRKQQVQVGGGKSTNLAFQFPEPTVNSTLRRVSIAFLCAPSK
jgi:hypothetical protein